MHADVAKRQQQACSRMGTTEDMRELVNGMCCLPLGTVEQHHTMRKLESAVLCAVQERRRTGVGSRRRAVQSAAARCLAGHPCRPPPLPCGDAQQPLSSLTGWPPDACARGDDEECRLTIIACSNKPRCKFKQTGRFVTVEEELGGGLIVSYLDARAPLARVHHLLQRLHCAIWDIDAVPCPHHAGSTVVR